MPAADAKPRERRPLIRIPPIAITINLPDIGLDGFDFGGNAAPAMPQMPGFSRAGGPEAPVSPGAPGRPSSPESPSPPAQDRAASQPSKAKENAAQNPSPASQRSDKGHRAMQVARGEIGVREQPKGSNRGPRVDEYQDGKGQYWCCHFVSWCVEQTGGSPFGHLGLVADLRRWGRNNGRYNPAGASEPLAGDIFTMARRDKKGRIVGGHTGFVTGYDARSGLVSTIEGNSDDRVKTNRRSRGSLDGFIRL